MVLDHKQLTCGSQTTSITLQISTVTNVEWRIWQSVFSWQRDCSSKPSEGPDAKLIGVIFSMCIFWSNMYIIFLYIHYLVWQIILENIKSFIRYDYLMLEWAGQYVISDAQITWYLIPGHAPHKQSALISIKQQTQIPYLYHECIWPFHKWIYHYNLWLVFIIANIDIYWYILPHR